MGRSFSKPQLRAAIETVQAAGLRVQAIEFPPEGGFKLVLNSESTETEPNPWDEVLGLEPTPHRIKR